MYKIKDLSNQNLNTDLIGKFVDFVVEKLQIGEPFTVFFVDDKENGEKDLGKTAMYNPDTKSVYIYATNRHPKDMMRSCAHELMHHKQNIAGELGKITPEEAERESNEAGYLLRQFEDGMKSKALEESIKIVLREREVGRYRGLEPSARVKPHDADWKLPDYGKYTKCLSHQRKHKDGRCYPKEFNKNFDMPVESWSLQDIINARKDLYKLEGGKVYTISEFDGDRPKRRSVFSDIKNLAIRKLILDKHLLLKVLYNLKIIRSASKPAQNYMKKYNTMLKDPTQICTMYNAKKYFNMPLTKLDMEVMTAKGCKDLVPKASTWQKTYLKVMPEQTKEQYVDQGPPMPAGESVPSRRFPAVGPQQVGTRKWVPDVGKFEIYGPDVLNAAYMIDRLSSNGVLRMGIEDKYPVTLPAKLIKDLFQFGAHGTGTSPKKYVEKAEGIYRVSPFTYKSLRAINNKDKEIEMQMHMTIAMVASVPLPGWWLADVVSAYIYIDKWRAGNKDKSFFDKNYLSDPAFVNALITAGFLIGFSRMGKDMMSAADDLKVVADSEKHIYEFALDPLRGTETYNSALKSLGAAADLGKRTMSSYRASANDLMKGTGVLAGESVPKVHKEFAKRVYGVEELVVKDLDVLHVRLVKYHEILRELKAIYNKNIKVGNLIKKARVASARIGETLGNKEIFLSIRNELIEHFKKVATSRQAALRKSGQFNIGPQDSIDEIAEKLANFVHGKVKNDPRLSKKIIDGAKLKVNKSAKQVEDKLITALFGDNKEATDLLRKALAEGDTQTAKQVAEEIFKKSGMDNQAVAYEKAREFIYGRTKTGEAASESLGKSALDDYARDEAQVIGEYYSREIWDAVVKGGGKRTAIKVQQARFARGLSREYFHGTGVGRNALEMYFTGNKFIYVMPKLLGTWIRSHGHVWTGHAIEWFIKFIVVKAHWPILAYLRYYRPWCGWSWKDFYGEYKKYLDISTIVNPFDLGFAKELSGLSDPIKLAINRAKTKKCKQFDALEKALPDGKEKEDLKKNFDRALVEIGAKLTEIYNKTSNNDKVQRAYTQFEKGLAQKQKELEQKRKEIQTIYRKCIEKDPNSKKCKAELENTLRKLRTSVGEVTDDAVSLADELTTTVTNVVGQERVNTVKSAMAAGIEATKEVVDNTKEAIEKLPDTKVGRAIKNNLEKATQGVRRPPGIQDVGAFEETKNLSLNDVLREHKEKELNDKFNKLIKGMTEQ